RSPHLPSRAPLSRRTCLRCSLPSAQARCLSSTLRPPPRRSLFPYTTLFRSPRFRQVRRPRLDVGGAQRAQGDRITVRAGAGPYRDRKSTRLNSSHVKISYAVFCLKKNTTLARSTRLALQPRVVRSRPAHSAL